MAAPRRVQPRLVGRAAELDAALRSIRQVGAATGHVLVIEGEAGVGKSRLVDEVLESAVESGFEVVRSAGRPLEVDLPFAPLSEALQVRLEDLGLVGGEAVPTATAGDRSSVSLAWGDDSGQRRLRMTELLVERVEGMAGEGRLALVLEDLHWADAGTLTVLGRLASRLWTLPLLLVASLRPYPRSDALAAFLEMLASSRATHVVLAGLDAPAVEELASEVLDAPPGPNLRAELAGTGGNPLYVMELLRALEEDDALSRADAGAEVAEAKLPPSLRVAILRRFAALPTDTTELLRVAAVLGSSFQPTALAVVSDRPETKVVAALEPALRSGLVTDAGDALAFRHDLVRDALYEDLPEAIRQALHARAARSLTAAGYPPLHVAPHLLRGALVAEPTTVAALRDAGEQLRTLAPDLSVELLERTVGLVGPSDHEYDDVRAELLMAYTWANRPLEATRLAEQLMAEVEQGPPRRSALFVRAIMSSYVGGGAETIDELTRTATELEDDAEERAQLLAAAAYHHVIHGDVRRGEEIARDAIRAGESAGDPLGHCAALSVLAMATQALGENREAVAIARRAVDVARRSRDDTVLLVAPELTYGMIAGNEPDLVDEAIAVVQEGLARAERNGLVGFEVNFREVLGVNLYRAGRWDEAAVELETSLARREELDAAPSELVHAATRLARIAVHRDDLPAAHEWVELAESVPEESVTHDTPVHIAYARAELLVAEGAAESALERLADAVRSLPSELRPMTETVTAAPRIRLALELGREEDARRWFEAVRSHPTVAAGDVVVPWMQALLDGDRLALDDTIAHVRVHGCPLAEDLPLMLEDAAELARPDDVDDAVTLLEEARGRWEDMGAIRDVARVDAKLRDLGVRRGVRGRRRRPSTGWRALTETERRVLDVVAEGLTYREAGERLFISRRTVETHISHIFTKLGVSNRGELVAAYEARERDRS